MIPIFAVFGVRTRRHRIFRIWIPIFLAWLLLLPLVLVLLPFFLVGCLILEVKGIKALIIAWQILSGLSGTHVEINDPEHYVLMRLV